MPSATPLLLLPGLLCDAALWQPQIDRLDGVAVCTVADLTQDDSIAAMARRPLAAIPPRFALAGLSMGGYVAFEILRQAPQRVTSALLLDTSARADTPEQARRRRGLMALALRSGAAGRFRGVTPRLLPQLLHPDSLADPAITQTVLGMAERVGRDAYLRQQRAILGRPDSRGDLPALRLPVQVAVGDGDAVTPPELAREIAVLIPGASFRLLAGSDHLPTLEQPARVAMLLRSTVRLDIDQTHSGVMASGVAQDEVGEHFG
jgi:pimeloyl-ACP methyl ester carboxylesterase